MNWSRPPMPTGNSPPTSNGPRPAPQQQPQQQSQQACTASNWQPEGNQRLPSLPGIPGPSRNALPVPYDPVYGSLPGARPSPSVWSFTPASQQQLSTPSAPSAPSAPSPHGRPAVGQMSSRPAPSAGPQFTGYAPPPRGLYGSSPREMPGDSIPANMFIPLDSQGGQAPAVSYISHMRAIGDTSTTLRTEPGTMPSTTQSLLPRRPAQSANMIPAAQQSAIEFTHYQMPEYRRTDDTLQLLMNLDGGSGPRPRETTPHSQPDFDSDDEMVDTFSATAFRTPHAPPRGGDLAEQFRRDHSRFAQILQGQLPTKRVASKRAIDALESVQIKDLPEADRDCKICYVQFGEPSPEGIMETPVRLPKCKHVFGDLCLKRWFKESDSCPYCRDKVHSERQKPTREHIQSVLHGARFYSMNPSAPGQGQGSNNNNNTTEWPPSELDYYTQFGSWGLNPLRQSLRALGDSRPSAAGSPPTFDPSDPRRRWHRLRHRPASSDSSTFTPRAHSLSTYQSHAAAADVWQRQRQQRQQQQQQHSSQSATAMPTLLPSLRDTILDMHRVVVEGADRQPAHLAPIPYNNNVAPLPVPGSPPTDHFIGPQVAMRMTGDNMVYPNGIPFDYQLPPISSTGPMVAYRNMN